LKTPLKTLLKTMTWLTGGKVLSFILGLYLLLSLSMVFTARPHRDEYAQSSPGYNLVYNGRMGFTQHEFGVPFNITARTYWQPPVFFLTTASWFRIVGFGLIQLRLLSVLCGVLALYSCYVIARSLFEPVAVAWMVAGLVSIDYFFVIGAALGRMDMLCAALGIASIAVYLSRRKKSYQSAIFWSHVLATMAVLTHPAGLGYWLGLAFLILYFDRRLRSLKTVALAALPCLIGGLSWGAYIAQDPAEFMAQVHGNLTVTGTGWEDGHWSSIPLVRNLQKELYFRYAAPFGLAAGVGLVNRLKALVLLAYIVGIAGSLAMARRRPNLLVFPVLAIISFLYLALLSPSKNSYYLPHTTIFMAASLAVFVCHLEFPDAVRKRMLAAAVLAFAMLQIGGLLFRVYQNPYRRSYNPAAAAIAQHSTPGSLVTGTYEFWFQLEPQRRVLNDPVLGYTNGWKPAIFVMDPMYREIHEDTRVGSPIYAYVQKYLDSSQLVYDDGYYQVYVPPGGLTAAGERRPANR